MPLFSCKKENPAQILLKLNFCASHNSPALIWIRFRIKWPDRKLNTAETKNKILM